MHGGREGRCMVVERAGAWWWQRGQDPLARKWRNLSKDPIRETSY